MAPNFMVRLVLNALCFLSLPAAKQQRRVPPRRTLTLKDRLGGHVPYLSMMLKRYMGREPLLSVI